MKIGSFGPEKLIDLIYFSESAEKRKKKDGDLALFHSTAEYSWFKLTFCLLEWLLYKG